MKDDCAEIRDDEIDCAESVEDEDDCAAIVEREREDERVGDRADDAAHASEQPHVQGVLPQPVAVAFPG